MLINFGVWRIEMLGNKITKTAQREQGKFRIAMKIAAPGLAVAGCLVMNVPSMAVTGSYNANDYRVCAGRLLALNVSPDVALQACSSTLRPRDLSGCVANIQKQTELSATDALSTCRLVRRPDELATCVVGISKSTKEPANPAILSYCSRSLLPVRFAQCVVGLRAEIDFPSSQAMDSCIDASERIGNLSPTFIPGNRGTVEFKPTFQTSPIPGSAP
jgi:hypothetical protein